VLKPLIEQPPHGWRGFEEKLSRLGNEVGRPSLLANVREPWAGSFRRLRGSGTSFARVKFACFTETHRRDHSCIAIPQFADLLQ